MEFLTAQLPFLVVLLYLVIMIVVSYKRGFAKEFCSLVAMIVASIAVLLIAFAIRAYFDQERLIFVITLILLFLLFVLYKIVDLALTSLKIVSKLPIIRLIDKPLGIIAGVAEVIITIWAVYCIVMVLDAGAFEKWVMNCVRNNVLMRFMYEYNYMYLIASKFSETLHGIDIWKKLGM